MKTAETIADLARAAGARGDTWANWTANCDEAQGFICSADNDASDAAVKSWEVAHRAGQLERAIAVGWVKRWTTAPADFDGFGTATVEECGTWNRRALRQVVIDPDYVSWQVDRYGSGIDDGTPGMRGVYGWIKGRDPTVHYAIEEHGWGNQTADEIMIRDSRGEDIGSLAMVARRLRENNLRVVTDADALPPEPVLRRLGLERRADVRRVEVRGHALWIARERFGFALVILDEDGHIARGKQIQAAARAAWNAAEAA